VEANIVALPDRHPRFRARLWQALYDAVRQVRICAGAAGNSRPAILIVADQRHIKEAHSFDPSCPQLNSIANAFAPT